MSKKTFVVFGLVVVVLVGAHPLAGLPLRRRRGPGAQQVPSDLKEGQSLFQTNCGTCHTLYAAGTDGNYAPEPRRTARPLRAADGPNAEKTIEGIEERVLNAIENGVDSTTTPGRMPPRSSPAPRPKRSPNSSPTPPARDRAPCPPLAARAR